MAETEYSHDVSSIGWKVFALYHRDEFFYFQILIYIPIYTYYIYILYTYIYPSILLYLYEDYIIDSISYAGGRKAFVFAILSFFFYITVDINNSSSHLVNAIRFLLSIETLREYCRRLCTYISRKKAKNMRPDIFFFLFIQRDGLIFRYYEIRANFFQPVANYVLRSNSRENGEDICRFGPSYTFEWKKCHKFDPAEPFRSLTYLVLPRISTNHSQTQIWNYEQRICPFYSCITRSIFNGGKKCQTIIWNEKIIQKVIKANKVIRMSRENFSRNREKISYLESIIIHTNYSEQFHLLRILISQVIQLLYFVTWELEISIWRMSRRLATICPNRRIILDEITWRRNHKCQL